MCSPDRIHLSDLDAVAAIMTATQVIPEVFPGKTHVKFSFPGGDDISSVISGYYNNDLTGHFKDFAANRAWCQNVAEIVAESGRTLCP